MKLLMRNWQWPAGLMAALLMCATYLVAQAQRTQIAGAVRSGGTAASATAPTSQETADCGRLIEAINTGNAQVAVEVLHRYGIAEDMLLAMATRLGGPTAPVQLKEPFLKASAAGLTVPQGVIRTNIEASLNATGAALGYERPVWMPRNLETKATTAYDAALIQCPVAPIALLDVRLNDPCLIRYFEWYDRYAEYLHSVVLNSSTLSNAQLDETNYSQASRTLNALFQLIKARKPDAFVWLNVVKEDDKSDEQWLKALTFKPDGLQISNLRQFHSPFAETRARYSAIVGPEMPMMVSCFYGYTAALQKKGKMLTAGMRQENSNVREADEAAAKQQLGGIGLMAGQPLLELETNLQVLGYRGLSTHWLLLAALANSNNSTVADKSDLIDTRAGLLDTYYAKGDYDHVFSLAADMVSNSASGGMDWTVGKLYEGIALLSQKPPDTTQASAILDELIAFKFKNRFGRDHYILGAVKWRIYAASLSGDTAKARELAQWAQNQDFRKDLKSNFLKNYHGLLPDPPVGSQN